VPYAAAAAMGKARKKDPVKSERARRQYRDPRGRYARSNPVNREAAAMTRQSPSNAAAAAGPSKAAGSAKRVSSRALFPAAPRIVIEVRMGFRFHMILGIGVSLNFRFCTV
jgi:hypothetical protein